MKGVGRAKKGREDLRELREARVNRFGVEDDSEMPGVHVSHQVLAAMHEDIIYPGRAWLI